MKAGEVQARRHRGFLGAVGELAARMRREQARESIDRVLPMARGAGPIGLRFGGFGGGLVAAHVFPKEPGHGRLATDAQLFGAPEGGVPDVAIACEEFVLGVERQRETFRRFGITAGREGFLGLRLQGPPLLPKRRGLQSAEPGVEQGAPAGVGQAGELPAIGDLLLAGDRPAELHDGRGFVVLRQSERRGLEGGGLLTQPLAAQEVEAATQGHQTRVLGADGLAGGKILFLRLQGLFQQADVLFRELEAHLPDFFEGRLGLQRSLTQDFRVSGRDRELRLAGRPSFRGVEQQGSDAQGGEHQQEQRKPDPDPEGLEGETPAARPGVRGGHEVGSGWSRAVAHERAANFVAGGLFALIVRHSGSSKSYLQYWKWLNSSASP